MLSNVLSNALRHTAAGGQVQVITQANSDMIQITVQGTGIAPEHLDRVFERFFRANAARTRGEGTGVGLTVARAMGGDLSVISALGQGAAFTLGLPTLVSRPPVRLYESEIEAR
ncbi:ATP-binding protein [Deinococcus multiflagellatus]|nr:ATP-binding protein [Deinococcus multiflagellatus]